MRKTRFAIRRPSMNTIRQAPKYAISSRGSTGGKRQKSVIIRNRNAGIATEKTNCVSASETGFGHFAQRVSR